MSPNDNVNWKDVAWALGIGAQGGLILALPVLIGLLVGYLLDRALGTLPLLTLLLLLPGMVLGPVLLYRRAISAVRQRMEPDTEQEDEENS